MTNAMSETDTFPSKESALATSPGKRWFQILIFSLPNFPISMLMMPAGAIIPSLYAKERAVDFAVIATILLAARIFDAVTDQAIGWASDKTNAKWRGGRKIWMAIGGGLAVPSAYFLFTPPETAGATYFAFWSFALYFSWTMLRIPHVAWATELSRHHKTRNRIFTVNGIFGELGSLLFLSAPLLLVALSMAETTEMNFTVMKYSAIAIAIVLPLCLCLCFVFSPSGPQGTQNEQHGLMDIINSFRSNKPLQIFLAVIFTADIGHGMFATLIFLYIDSYLQIGESFSYLVVGIIIPSILVMPLWAEAANRFGKIRILQVSWLLYALSILTLIFIPKDGDGFTVAMFCMLAIGLSNSGSVPVVPSILGDIIDYDTLKTKSRRAGLYFAALTFFAKIVAAIGGSLAFILLDIFNYNLDDTATNSDSNNLGMLLGVAILPAALRITSAFFLTKFPINAWRQNIIQKRLESLESRALLSATSSLSTQDDVL